MSEWPSEYLKEYFKNRCASCKWWNPHNGVRELDLGPLPPKGDCQIRAPVLLPSIMERFPMMLNRGWCGEFTELEDKKPSEST